MKKFLSAIITIALIISFIPAANASALSGSAGPNLTWTLDSAGLLSISGTGPMDEWRVWVPMDTPGQYTISPYAPWHRHRDSIRSVHISEGVTTIGSNAFLELGNITAVNIPASVTHIGGGAFSESGITSITIPSTVKRISEGAFNRCNRLTHVTIGAEYLGMDPTEVDRLGFHLFNNQFESKGLDSITHVTIQGSVKQIPAASFIWLLNLESLRIEEGVTKIHSSAFMNCISLPSVTLPNSLTAIGFQTFAGTDSLPSITIPRNVTSIDTGAFRGNEGRIITLRGYAGSAAQTHANNERQFGVRFEAITGDLPDVLPLAPTPPPPLFGDLAGVSAEGLANIEFVFEKGLMSGSGGNFMPTQAARNAQFLAILSRLAGAGVTDGSPWFAPYVDWARDFGIIGAGEFNADSDMAREDMALWMYRYITISGIELPSVNGKPNYQDIAGLSEEQRIAAEALFDWGIIRGSNPGVTFGTGDSSERVALANVLARFVRMLP